MNRRDAIKATLLGAIGVATGGVGALTGLFRKPSIWWGRYPQYVARGTITEMQARELVALAHKPLTRDELEKMDRLVRESYRRRVKWLFTEENVRKAKRLRNWGKA